MSTPREDSNLDISKTYGFHHEHAPTCFDCVGNLHASRKFLDKIRRRAQQRSCCAVLLDAFETWNECGGFEDIKYFPIRMLSEVDNKITIYVGDGDSRRTTLVVYRSQSSSALSDDSHPRVADLTPKWAKGLKNVRSLQGDTSSTDSLQTLKSWLSTCDCDHGCYVEADHMPGRVIEITKSCLFLREGLVGSSKYACLSHCWGMGGLQYKLVKANKMRFCQGFMMRDLPKTFQDAVKVCLRLGIQFLWIDALCIVQDDLEDWTQTSAVMADIYRNAFITIAATASHNSNEGLFRHSPANTIPRPLRRMPGLVVREQRWPDDPLMHYRTGIADCPLLKRAWVYQERRMSPRTVHFTSAQLVWECLKFIIGEDATIIRKEEREDEIPNADELPSRSTAWQKTVTEYSGLDISFDQDRLPAIAAIVVEELKAHPTDKCIVGMWKNTFLNDILWSHDSLDMISRAGPRPDQPFPSWSWASVKKQVAFREVVPLPSVKVVSFSFTGEGPPQMGGYIEATVIITGPLINAVFRYPKDELLEMYHLEPQSPTISLPSEIIFTGHSVDFDFLSISRKTATASENDFSFILIGADDNGKFWGLVLRKRAESGYERVGTCWCLHDTLGEYGRVDEGEKERRVRAFIDSLPVKEVKIM